MSNLFAFGFNNYGQLGLGDADSRSSPVQVGTLSDWSQATGFEYSSSAIKDNGTLWAWGKNASGQLGLGDTDLRSSPVQVGTLSDWSQVAGGSSGFVLAIKNDGTLWAWGYNSDGELGLGDTVNRSSPVQVGALTDWSQVIAGYYHSLAVKNDGTLWAWGKNNYGQLGLGDTDSRSSPVQVGTLSDWSQVAAGYYHSLALKNDGTLWAWGYNTHGELGLGDTVNRSSPVQVGALTDWSQAVAGYLHSFALKNDGTLWTWGSNNSGQLGLGDTVNRSSPVQVGALTDWSQATASVYASLAVKSDGTLWSWGYNNYGELGLGDTNDRSSPVQVGSLAGWSQAAGHSYSSLVLFSALPSIVSGEIAANNSSCKIVFSKPVYSDAAASQTINKDDLNLLFSQNGGDASAASITGLYADSGLTTSLSSATGYDTVYAKLSITGVPTGAETIEIKPASGSTIYDASGNAMPDTETTGALSLYNVPASIINGVMSNDNAYVEIDFSEAVWADSGNTAELTSDSFLVDFQQNGGGISGASINALYQDAALSNPLASGVGYSTVYAQLLVTSGFPTGDETIEIKPKDGSSIFDSSGGAMDAAETTGLLYFHSAGSTVSLNWSTLDPVISALRSIISLFLVSLFGHGLHVFFTDKALFQEVENDLHTRISSLPAGNQALGIELLNFFQRFYSK